MEKHEEKETAQVTRNSQRFVTLVKEGKTYHISKMSREKLKFVEFCLTAQCALKKRLNTVQLIQIKR